MKFIGICFIVFSFSSIGYLSGNRYISMLKDIKRIENFIKNIILFLKNENMTVNEIFKNCAVFGDEKTKDFLVEIQKNESVNISNISEQTGFCKNKTANLFLQEVFLVLGKYSSEEQIKEFEFCRSKIKNLYEKEEADYISKAKLCRNLGFLSGIFVSIIII